MLGGINNIDIINASQRGARDKLNQMAGIKRPPSGILASSPELMQAVAGAPPAMPIRPTGPATPIPMVQPALPQVPMQTAVASAPRPMAPAPAVPTVPQPASPTTPMKFQEAGPVDIRKTPTVSDPASAFVDTVNSLGAGVYEALLKRYGSPEKTEQAVKGQVAAVKAAVETGNPENIANTVIDQAGLPLNDESKKDFARTVFGLDDVNDIDEINRRIADVAIGASVGKGPDKFAQAVLLGLQNYKQTASARAAAKSGGSSGFEPMPRYGEALPNMVKTIMQNDPGVTVEEAMVEARKVLDPLYGRTGGGAPTQQQPQNTEQMPTTPGTRFRDNQTGKIMVVGEDGKPREE